MTNALEGARERRASLRSAMGEVESALAAPAPGREEPWRRELALRLRSLDEAMERHVAGTEGDGGLLAEIMASAPRLAHRVEQAKDDHARLRAGIAAACATVEAEEAVAGVRDRVVTLLTEVVRHRQLGADLVYDALNVDIDAAD